MSDRAGWQFRPEDLLFFGQRSASVSHELKNVMSIINESAGLLGDLAAASSSGKPMDPARVAKIAANIGRNVQRGVAIIDRLNRFSHSVDEPLRGVDLVSLLDDVVALTQRFAGLHGASIEARLSEASIDVRSYVFGLHQILTEMIRLGVVALGGYEPVRISLEPAGGGGTVTVVRGPVVQPDELAARQSRIESLAAELGCTVEFGADEEGRGRVVLTVPARP